MALGILAEATTRLGLGSGIVNPPTRHPVVIASAMASLQLESRAAPCWGVGRGDSSLAQIDALMPAS